MFFHVRLRIRAGRAPVGLGFEVLNVTGRSRKVLRMFFAKRQSSGAARVLQRFENGYAFRKLNSIQDDIMSTKINPNEHDSQNQGVPSDEVRHTKAGARGVHAGGNAGAMGDPVSDQSQHNYQVSRETDLAQYAYDAERSKFNVQGSKSSQPLNLKPGP
jgi:hypothetical protein